MPKNSTQRPSRFLQTTQCHAEYGVQGVHVHPWWASFSPEMRRLLQVAAVLGPTFAPGELARLLHEPVASMLPTIEELLAVGVIRYEDRTFAFRDADVWQEVVSSIPRPVLYTLREEAAILADGIAERRTVASTVRLSNLRWNQGAPAESIALSREALAAVSDSTPVPVRFAARLALGCKLLCLREFEEAESLIDAARQETARHEVPDQMGALQAITALSLMLQGMVSEASTGAMLVLRDPGMAADQNCGSIARAVLALAALRDGDSAASSVQVRRFGKPPLRPDSFFPAAYPEWVAFLAATERCESADALDTALTCFPDLLGRGVLWYQEPAAAPWLMRLALDSGNRQIAAKILDEVSQIAVEMPETPAIAAVPTHCQALVDGDPQGLEHAAVTHLDPWCAGLAAEDLAVRLLEQGQEASVVGLWLESALRHFTALGASRDAGRIRERLTRPGAGQVSGGRETSIGGQWTDLTQDQRKVAQLVLQGLTNRQVAESIHISPHTVNYHLRRIYQKLGISSRVELARIAPAAV